MENQMKNNAGSPGVESLVERGYLFLEDSEWNKADEYFDKALDINPKHAPAYIGKLCAELKARREDSLGDYNELRQGKKIDRPLGEYGNFQKALRFADDVYRKKLNDFDQKIKSNFPRIPQRFTDEFIKSEIARLEKEIANCDAEIAKGEKDYKACDSLMKMYSEEHKKIINDYVEMYPFSAGYDQEYRSNLMSKNESYLRNRENFNSELEERSKAWKHVDEYKDKKAKYEAKKLDIVPLADISCLDRMDVYYNRLVEAMQKETTEEGYKNLAEQFRSLEGYKDSEELAGKCGKLVIKKQFEKLVQEKNNAKTEEKYIELSKSFRKMGGYENSAQLAEECDKLAEECVRQKEREKKARYDDLVKGKSTASSEDGYFHFAQEFRNMGNYENAAQLASECEKQGNILKERRMEQERQAKRQREEQERLEQAENEKRYRYEEEQKRLKQRAMNIRGFMLTFVPFILGLFFYFIACRGSRFMNDTESILAILAVSVIFLGVPIIIIHLRYDWSFLSKAAVVVFGIAILALTFLDMDNFVSFPGSLAMLTAFIMSIKNPKDKYWGKMK